MFKANIDRIKNRIEWRDFLREGDLSRILLRFKKIYPVNSNEKVERWIVLET